MNKPMYTKVATSKEFTTRAQAVAYAKDKRKEYKAADQSIKYDISRTPSSGWKAVIYAKV